jgi:radical S-adenosyl methionine domain-containing protein 2
MIIETVNLHIWSWCNLRCVYCYETFPEKPRSLSLADWRQILAELKAEGVVRVTFSGGEPTLHPALFGMLEHARRVGLQTSIVTNGAKLTDPMLERLDVVGVTLDAVSDHVLTRLGRQQVGGPPYVAELRRIGARAQAAGVVLKINTVVTAVNIDEELAPTIVELRPYKWKPMQFTHVPGENDGQAAALRVTSTAYDEFVARHRPPIEAAGAWVQPESSEVINSTYVMIDPMGRVFQVGPQGHVRSEPVLQVGLTRAIEQAGGYDRARFVERGGHVDVKRLRVVQGGRR